MTAVENKVEEDIIHTIEAQSVDTKTPVVGYDDDGECGDIDLHVLTKKYSNTMENNNVYENAITANFKKPLNFQQQSNSCGFRNTSPIPSPQLTSNVTDIHITEKLQSLTPDPRIKSIHVSTPSNRVKVVVDVESEFEEGLVIVYNGENQRVPEIVIETIIVMNENESSSHNSESVIIPDMNSHSSTPL